MKKTQKDMVLEHLQSEGSITSWEAIKEYGCTRLADVIFVLKKEYSILSERMSGLNRQGQKISFAKYTLIGKKQLN